MGRGPAAGIAPPTDMPDLPWIQWRVENVEEIARFLEEWEVRLRAAPANNLLVQGISPHPGMPGMNLQVSPGDCLVLWPATAEHPREQLGVVRVPESAKFRESENIEDMRL